MRNRVKIILAIVLAAAAALATWEGLRSTEPMYDGKPLGYWVRSPTADPETGLPSFMSRPALDAKEVPFLIRCLEMRDSAFHQFYLQTWPKLPVWVTGRLPEPVEVDSMRHAALGMLGRMGADAKPAVPALIRVLGRDKASGMRPGAIGTLRQFAKDDPKIKAALVEALRDKDSEVRFQAAVVLIDAGVTGQPVVNALLKCLQEPDFNYRSWVTNQIRRISPTALSQNGEPR